MRPTFRSVLVLTALASLMLGGVSLAVAPHGHSDGPRNFDARIELNQSFRVPVPASQSLAIDALRAQVPELAVTFEGTTGVTRSLYNTTGYLTNAQRGEPMDLALDFVNAHSEALGLTREDVRSFYVQDEVFTRVTGATHLYLVQEHQGLVVYNAQLHVNVNRDGRILSVNNGFLRDIARLSNSTTPALDAPAAVLAAARHLEIETRQRPEIESQALDPQRTTLMQAREISLGDIEAKLMWLPVRAGTIALVWNFQIQTLDSQHWYDINVDAATGEVWTRFDWVNSGTYRVYEQPTEDPNSASPLPPGDGRTLVVNPENGTASPSGWFGGGVMDGNNVHACADVNANNGCDTPEPSCSGTTCDFPINLSSAPSNSSSAAIANLFYWNNVIHDIQYQYGFDEAGGNFQENNFGNGGAGSDSVNADALDGSGNCNANFATPTDGGNPRMQMFTCTNASPARDGDYDNGVIVHEYGHGISIRQVGGPGNSSCLNNSQQAGEGWSDWLGLAYTAEVGDQGADPRGLGAYLFNAAVTIRDLPYSTDNSVNNWTYESISGSSIPHGVGSRWAQAIWDVYWALVDQHGFDADLYDANGGSGNQRAMLYINEGLKNTACSPTFVNNRDGIIQAATDNFGGADVCLIWQAFADWGLGTDAVSGGSNSTNPTNGFSVPASCQCSPQPIADAGPDQTINVGQSATLGTAAQGGTSYSWAPGGQTSAQITVSPSSSTTYTVTATNACGSASDSATVTVLDPNCAAQEFFEGGAAGWFNSGASTCTTGSFVIGTPTQVVDTGVTTQVGGDHTSGTGNAFFSAVNTAAGVNDIDGGTCIVESPVYSVTQNSDVSLWFFHGQRDAGDDAGDFFSLEMSTDGGATYSTLVSFGDVTVNAAWTQATASVSAGSQVKFRVSAADAPGGGDLVEAGIDDLEICGDGTGGNTAPTVNITAPANGSSFGEGASVTFSGTATDTEDGTISGSLSWTSSLDGSIGSGASFSTSGLSVGTHTITASVTDSGGLSDSDSISVTIVENNTAPTVNITAPANGSTFTEGASVTFSGTATDAQDGTISGSLSWTSSLDGSIGSGASFSTSGLSVGTHTITASVTDSGGLSGSDSISVTIEEDTGGSCPSGSIDFNTLALTSYSNQNVTNGTQVLDGGDTLRLTGNTWVRSTASFNVTAGTVIEFDFTGAVQGEIHAIGFDENDTLNDSPRHFQFWGTQNWTGTGKIDFNPKYSGSGSQSFSVPVGQSYTGTMFLVFTNDDDASAAADSSFSCVRIVEPPPPTCTVDEDFESGSAGWVNDAASTCSTGAYVEGNPTQQTSGGVTTQVAGSNSGVNSLFTASNSSAGNADVDGGNCILGSPTWAVANASTLSVAYFHGQRDAGDDASGDFFLLEYSTNGGASWNTLASNGDSTSTAAWATATTAIPAGSNVALRVQCSDGAGPGDIVECGIDDVSICE